MAKGSVRKKGKKWYYRFYIEDENGNRVQKEFPGTESKSETEGMLRKAMEDYEAKKVIAKPDMTVFKNKGTNWEWTLLVDTFNNEILAHQATPVTGSNKPYYHCLEILKKLAGKKNEEQTPQVVFHTDQGSVYSSQAFCQAHEHYNILRSMSKGGTPTDNAIMEALNGWIKEELYLDFGLESAEDVPKLLDEYVYYFNNMRPAAALGYKSPVQYKTELGF